MDRIMERMMEIAGGEERRMPWPEDYAEVQYGSACALGETRTQRTPILHGGDEPTARMIIGRACRRHLNDQIGKQMGEIRNDWKRRR